MALSTQIGLLTDANGQAVATLRAVPGTTLGLCVITAVVNRMRPPNIIVTGHVTIVGPPASLTVNASPNMVVCGEEVTLVVGVRDAIGQNVADGTRIELKTNPGGALVPDSIGTVSGSGTAFLLTSSSHTGPYTVIANVGSIYATVTIIAKLPEHEPAHRLAIPPEPPPFNAVELDSFAQSTGMLAVVFTDIVNSTTLTRQLGDAAWAELLNKHNRIVEFVVQKHRGKLDNSTGDGFLIIFRSAVDASSAAIDLLSFVKPLELELRIGIDVGEPIRVGDLTYVGSVVNKASRIMSQAAPDSIVVSQTVRSILENRAEFSFTNLGDFALKGFEGQHKLFNLSLAND